KRRAIATDPAAMVNGRFEYPSKLLRFAGAKPASHWSVPREIAIAESVFVRVQFMSRRRERIETPSPRKMPIRDMHFEPPFSISSFGKLKTRAAAPATKSRNSGFGL